MGRWERAVFKAAPVLRRYLCPPWNRAFEIESLFSFSGRG